MRLPRFTVRQLMIAVAIVGLLVAAGRWVVEMRTRSALYNRRAIDFANCTVGLFSAGSKAFITRKDGTLVHANDTEYKLLNNAWAYKMAVKYRRLSYYPWLPVEPDLPRPDPLAKYQDVFNCSLPIEENPWPRYGNMRPPAWTFLWAWRRQ
jgi:hypothetical protein